MFGRYKLRVNQHEVGISNMTDVIAIRQYQLSIHVRAIVRVLHHNETKTLTLRLTSAKIQTFSSPSEKIFRAQKKSS